MRLIVVITAAAIVIAACAKKGQEPPAPPSDDIVATGLSDDAGLASSSPPPVVPVEMLYAPMVIGGYNVPQPRGFRRAQQPDTIGLPQIAPWLVRGDVVLIDEAAFPPGTVDIGFVSMLNLPATLTAADCTTLANGAVESDRTARISSVSLLATGLGPTCSYELKVPAGVVRAAIAVIDGRALGVMASHAEGDDKTATAWSEIVKGMRKTNP